LWIVTCAVCWVWSIKCSHKLLKIEKLRKLSEFQVNLVYFSEIKIALSWIKKCLLCRKSHNSNRLKPRSHCPGPNFLKQPGLTGTHQGAKQRRLIPGHHHSSSGMNRISIVRPPGDTVANLHELCSRWSYDDSWLSHGVSQRRASIAQTLAGRTMVCNDGSRWMPVKLQWGCGMTMEQAGGPRLKYINSI